MVNIEIDEGSGFCFGVTTAIRKAEEELAKGNTLYCLGDIVHNGQECERLKKMGLITINHGRKVCPIQKHRSVLYKNPQSTNSSGMLRNDDTYLQKH